MTGNLHLLVYGPRWKCSLAVTQIGKFYFDIFQKFQLGPDFNWYISKGVFYLQLTFKHSHMHLNLCLSYHPKYIFIILIDEGLKGKGIATPANSVVYRAKWWRWPLCHEAVIVFIFIYFLLDVLYVFNFVVSGPQNVTIKGFVFYFEVVSVLYKQSWA